MNSQAKWTTLLIFGCLLFLFTACTPSPCTPTLDVTKTDDTNNGDCSPGDCSLREAVVKANTCPGLQTINLPAGEYILTLDGNDEELGATGDLDITDDLIIIGNGSSIDGNIERSFHIHSGADVEMEGIWLMNGNAMLGSGLINEGTLKVINFKCSLNSLFIPQGMNFSKGGCIYNTDNLVVASSLFLTNYAAYGGAIYNLDNATALVVHSRFLHNETLYSGGALWNGIDAVLSVYDSTFETNEAGTDGGGIWNQGEFLGVRLIIKDNLAYDRGGGVYTETNPIWTGFIDSWIKGNSANWGGGLFNNNGKVRFLYGAITNNIATGPVGGGIYNNGPQPTSDLVLTNVTVSHNTAPSGVGGAGIYNTGNFDFRFVTVANNNPGGIRVDTGTARISSSILANNVGGDCDGITPDSLDYNLTSDSTCAFVGNHDIINVTPMIEPLGFHGGTGPSHPLMDGSPALDSSSCISNDQNYISRPQGGGCDRGAVENLYEKGILRGWTYTDFNRNNIREPSEGPVSDVTLDLKEGFCPGGSVKATVVSDPSGRYEIYDIQPGEYCIDARRLDLIQTLDPNYIDLSFAAGDVLEDVNFRYLLYGLGESSISGKVWHDECMAPYSTSTQLNSGCIRLVTGVISADGIYNPSEPGIEGIKVRLFSEDCPDISDTDLIAVVFTDANGDYTFPGLPSGNWCIEIDPNISPNDSILLPGDWTYPILWASPAEADVSLGSSEDVENINFGWDYQFLPEPLIPYSQSCIGHSSANIRRGPGTDFLPTSNLDEGEPFEVQAKSEQEDPLWLFGKKNNGDYGWVSLAVLDCDELDPSKLIIHWTPLRLPTPIPTPASSSPESSSPGVCKPDLPENKCIRAGGTYIKVNDNLSICDCP